MGICEQQPTNPCRNGGTCFSSQSGFTCQCFSSWI